MKKEEEEDEEEDKKDAYRKTNTIIKTALGKKIKKKSMENA